MKVTIEASDPNSFMGKGHSRVVIDTNNDDVNLSKALETLVSALSAYGFHQNSVEEAIIELGAELQDAHDNTHE